MIMAEDTQDDYPDNPLLAQFEAAIVVVDDIKSGRESFELSQDTISTFAVLHKQATLGDCQPSSKPPVWKFNEVAEYHAWLALTGMEPATAMRCYIAQLEKIIETLNLTAEVANFIKLRSRSGQSSESAAEADVNQPTPSDNESDNKDEFADCIGLTSNSDNVSEYFSIASDCDSTYFSDGNMDDNEIGDELDEELTEDSKQEDEISGPATDSTAITSLRFRRVEQALFAISSRLTSLELVISHFRFHTTGRPNSTPPAESRHRSRCGRRSWPSLVGGAVGVVAAAALISFAIAKSLGRGARS